MMSVVLSPFIQLLAITPLAMIAVRMNGRIRTGVLVAGAILFIVTSVATDALAAVILFVGQQWNWVGKMASLLIALLFINAHKPYTYRDFGLTTKVELTNAFPILLIGVIYLLFRLMLYVLASPQPLVFDAETLLFQATLPGIEEEVIFRGILLMLFNLIFITPKWEVARVQFGWGTIITAVLFGFVHGLYIDSGYHLQLLIFSTVRATFDGFLFALLTEKTKSLLPAIVLHNLLNLVGNH